MWRATKRLFFHFYNNKTAKQTAEMTFLEPSEQGQASVVGLETNIKPRGRQVLEERNRNRAFACLGKTPKHHISW